MMISRKNFFTLAATFLGLVTVMKFVPFNFKEKSKKYLTPDGKLVEVNPRNILTTRKAFTSEIKHWVSTKKIKP